MKYFGKGSKRMLSLLMAVAVTVVSVPQGSLCVNAAEPDTGMEGTGIEGTEAGGAETEPAWAGRTEISSGDTETVTETGTEAPETELSEKDEANGPDVTEASSGDTETVTETGTEAPETEPSEKDEANGPDVTEASSGDIETVTETGTEAPETDGPEDSLTEDAGTEESQEETISAADLTASNDAAEDGKVVIAQKYCEDPNVKWTLYSDGELIVEGEGEIIGSDGYSPWYEEYRDKITSATVRVTGATSAENMFAQCGNLETADLTGFDTRKVTNMRCMFRYCRSLTDVDVSGFNTENVTEMYGMFSYCEKLTKLDLSRFNTENVTEMYGMFSYCEKLAKLDLSHFNTAKVRDLRSLLQGCSSLTEVDISGFNIANGCDMEYMFAGCTALEELDLGSFEITYGQNIQEMLFKCGSLRKITTPKKIERDNGWGIKLPEPDGSCSWRKPDGTRVLEMDKDLEGGTVLRTDAYIGIRFEGTNFKLAEYPDKSIEDIEIVFEKGAKDSLTFTIVPDAGYDVTPTVAPKTPLTKVTVSQGDSPYQYTVTPQNSGGGVYP